MSEQTIKIQYPNGTTVYTGTSLSNVHRAMMGNVSIFDTPNAQGMTDPINNQSAQTPGAQTPANNGTPATAEPAGENAQTTTNQTGRNSRTLEDRLKGQKQAKENAQRCIEKQKEKIRQLEQQLTQANGNQEKISELTSKIDKCNEKIGEQTNLINKLDAKMTEMAKNTADELKAMQNKLAEMEANGQKNTEAFNKLQEQFNKKSQDVNKSIETLRKSTDKRVRELGKGLEIRKSEIDELGKVVGEQGKEIGNLGKSVAGQKEEIDKLRKSTHERVVQLGNGLNEHKAKIDELGKVVGKQGEEIETLAEKSKKQTGLLKSIQSRLFKTNKKVGGIEARVGSLEEQVKKLTETKASGKWGKILKGAGLVALAGLAAFGGTKLAQSGDSTKVENNETETETETETVVKKTPDEPKPVVTEPEDTIPTQPKPVVTEPEDVVDEDKTANNGKYTVTKGDNVWNIAKEKLTEANGKKPTDKEIAEFTQKIIDVNKLDGRWNSFVLIHPEDRLIIPEIKKHKVDVAA